VGLATFRPDDNANSLLERADDCMYTAKRMGRNRVATDASAPEGLADVA
jgi:diguanylate cyclase